MDIVDQTAGTVHGFLSIFPGEAQQFDTLVHSTAVDALHVVQLRLGQIDTGQMGNSAQGLDVVITPSAEMDHSAAEMGQQPGIVGEGVFLVELRRQIHGAVVAQYDVSPVTELRPMASIKSYDKRHKWCNFYRIFII